MLSGDLPPKEETERYIRRSSKEWAAVGVTGDTSPLSRILAEDYEGVGARGDVRDKADAMALPAGGPPFSASKVDYVNFRHYGCAVIAQGAETLHWRDASRQPLRLIWTDIWLFRNGLWQVVASQDSIAGPPP